MKPRARRCVVLATVAAALTCTQARAADVGFEYDAAVAWLYSQDVLRTGDNANDDYITTAHVTAGLVASTPRSDFSLRYAPEYVRYEYQDIPNAVDHRLRTSWRLSTGPLSTFDLRQGLSESTRQVGFQDFADLGGNVSEPITARTRRVVWDLEPRFSRITSEGTTATFAAIYREERFHSEKQEVPTPPLLDSRQIGIEGAVEKRIGRSQHIGGRVRADKYSYFTSDRSVTEGFDQFIRAEGTWARRIAERVSLEAGAGTYRSSGPGVAAVVRPTLDISGQWSWRRVYLLVAYELSYTSGGGISTSNRSQWGHVGLTGTWGNGFEAGSDVSYISRASPTARLGDERPLGGHALGVHLSKSWASGIGMIVRLSGLQQERQVGPDLDYNEAVLGVTYAPPRQERTLVPIGWRTPGGRAPRVP